MAVTKYVELNNGSVVTLSAIELSTNIVGDVSQLPDGRRGWRYLQGTTNASSVLNLQNTYDQCAAKTGISRSIWTTIVSYQTPEYIAGDTYQLSLAALLDSMVWIWGSFDANGGYGFYKYESYVRVFQYFGKYQDGDSKIQLRFIDAAITANVNGIDRSTLDDVVICLEYSEGFDAAPGVVMFMHNDPESYYGSRTYYLDNRFGWVQPSLWTYYPVYTTVPSVLCGDCIWSSMLFSSQWTDYAERAWYIDSLNARTMGQSLSGCIAGDVFGGSEVDEEGNPYDNAGYDDEEYGDGSWDGSSTSNPASDMNDITDDAINSGFVTLYNPTKPQIQSFNDWLWTSITDSLADQIKRLIVNPLDAILFIGQCHLTPPTKTNTEEISFCGIGSNVYANVISRQFSTFDCGTLTFGGDTNSFMDYQPYSKAEIYLPCIGYKELDINDVMKSTISLKYQVDWVSGSCLAQLEFTRTKRSDGDAALNKNTIYEFQGNIYVNLPLSATDWKTFYSNMLSFGNGMANAIGGNVAGGVSQMISSVAQQQVNVQKSGSVASSFGYMGQQDISLFITRPNLAIPVNYQGFKGFLSNKRKELGSLTGYTEIETNTLWVDKFNDIEGLPAITEEESDMLKQICNSGFYL